MPGSQPFVDHYAVLQVSPGCDLKIVEAAYRHFAKVYHPDHAGGADPAKFQQIIDAWNVLKFPDKRAIYDQIWQAQQNGAAQPDDPLPTGTAALTDAALQQGILFYLYRARRENFRQNGVGGFAVQDHFGLTDDNFDFHVWYLKEKGFIETTEAGTLAITVGGVDHVIALHTGKAAQERFITDQSAPG